MRVGEGWGLVDWWNNERTLMESRVSSKNGSGDGGVLLGGVGARIGGLQLDMPLGFMRTIGSIN